MIYEYNVCPSCGGNSGQGCYSGFVTAEVPALRATNERLRVALDVVRASGLLIGSTTLHDKVRAVVHVALAEEKNGCGCAPGDCAADEIGGPCRRAAFAKEKQEIDVAEWDKTRWD
jgi:hypothetical protein